MVMYRLEATFVKRAVVRYQRKALDLRRNFRPNQWKFECIASIPVCKSVNTGIPDVVKVRYRADEPVNGVDDPSVADNHYSHAANAASESVCGFKVYSSEAAPKIRHLFCNFPQNYDNFPSWRHCPGSHTPGVIWYDADYLSINGIVKNHKCL